MFSLEWPIDSSEVATMAIGATTSINPYTNPYAALGNLGTAVPTSTASSTPGTTKDSATLQALASTLSSRPTLYDSTGALNTAGASQFFSNLTSSLNSLTSGTAGTGSAVDLLSSLGTQGGLTSSAASLLFPSSSTGSSALSASAFNLDASMALASYNYQQSQSSSNSGAASTSSTANSSLASTLQAAIASAQTTSFASSFNLVG
jgi:hypothetical protein